jgi:hypothetical protein
MTRARVAAAAAAVLLIGVSVFGVTLSASAGPLTAPVLDLPLGGPDSDDQPQAEGTIVAEGVDIDVTVTVVNSLGTSTYCTDTVLAGQVDFSCVGAVLPYGDNTFTATSAYTLGMPDALPSPVSNAVVYEHYGMQPVLFAVTPPAADSDATPTFSGTGPSLGTVDARSGISILCSTTVAADGTWSCDAAPALALGPYGSINARGIDMGGGVTNDFAADFTVVAPNAPTIDPLVPYQTVSSNQPSIQGNKDAGVTSIVVEVADNPGFVGASVYCTPPAGGGATVWFCPSPSGVLPTLGTNYLRATGSSENGATSPAGASTTATLVDPPTITSHVDGAFTSDNTPTFAGSSTAVDVDLQVTGIGVVCNGVVTPGDTWTCTPAAPIGDGSYLVRPIANYPDLIYGLQQTITIDTVAPAGPVITGPGPTTTNPNPVISGSAEPFATITVYRDGLPAACQGGPVTADAVGAWSCTSTATLAVGGTFDYGAVQVDRAGNASMAGVPPTQLSVTIVPAAAPVPAATTPPLVFQAWTFQFAAAGSEFEPGDTTRLTGAGLPPGALVDVEFHSTPVKVGSTTVAPDGSFDILVRIPEDAEPGEHRFVVLVTPVEGLPSTQEQAVTVVLPTKSLEVAADAAAAAESDSGGSGVDRSDPAAASGLTGSIQTIGSILANPVIIGTAALSGFALLLLVAFPAELLNSTLSEQYQRFSRRVPKLTALERFTNWLERVPWLGGLAITAVAAFIFGFADPGFGFDLTSLRVVLACAIALFIVGYLASSIAGVIIRGRWSLATTMELKPLGLVLTIAGVVLSRLLDFSPGFLIGLLLGIGLVGRTTVGDRARATLVQAGVVFALAILGWVGYSILMAVGDPDGFAQALALDTMVAITTEGLTALFIGLLPFRLLDGAAVFAHSKLVWAAAYTVAAAAFVLIVVPSAWGEFDGSLWLWIAVVGGFAIIAVAIYLYFRFVASPVDDGEEEQESELTDARR